MLKFMYTHNEIFITLFLQLLVLLMCIVLNNDIKKEIQYNLVRIRAGYRDITKNRAIGLLAERFFLDIMTLMFLLLVCANSYRIITYI